MMTDKRYCEGIDCAWCNQEEPCIYRIANELKEQIKRKEQEYEKLIKVNSNLYVEILAILKENTNLQQQINQLEDEYKILENNLDSRTRDFEDIIDEYKQNIKDIKKISKSYCDSCKKFVGLNQKLDCKYCNYNKVLQKIKEITNE